MADRVTNRWLVVAGGILVQLCLGAIYAWSAFTGQLTDPEGPFRFTRSETQAVFSVGLITFTTVMALFAGRWQARVGARPVAMAGGVLLGAGYVVASRWSDFGGILLGIGLLGGAGIGLAYVCPIAALVKWFPDRKGFISGLAVAGFGFGALVWIKLATGFRFGPVDLTPGWHGLFGAPPALASQSVIESSAGSLQIDMVADGLDEPWGIDFLPDGSFLLRQLITHFQHLAAQILILPIQQRTFGGI